ncbi:MAG TPA: hypothetical protein VGH19_07675 [Verrucomicrobiae bacterium]
MRISEHYWWVPPLVIFGGLLSVSVILLVRKKVVSGILLGIVTLFLFAVVAPSMRSARPQAQRNACLANVKQLTMAAEQWSKENNKVAGDKIDVVAAVAYLKGGHMPVCSRGGFYSFSVVGKSPECSLPEHDSKIPPYKP